MRLLVLTAHPDDEGFGMAGSIARAAERGWDVTVVCATRGEVGEISDHALATPESLPQVREQELRDACAALGVADVRLLGYRDSGMEGSPDNADPRALANADPATVVAEYRALLRELRPAVVLTWDPTGGYGHPDHIAVYRHAAEAVRQAVAAGEGPASLYYTVLPVQRFAAMAERLEREGTPIVNAEMREAMLRQERLPGTTVIDVRTFLPRKYGSMAAHRTQMGDTAPFMKLPQVLRDEFMGTEHFHRAIPAWRDGEPEEHDFYTGE